MPGCPTRVLFLDPCEVWEWSIEIIVTTIPKLGAESLSVGVRFNHEQEVWCPVWCASMKEAEASCSRYEGMSLEEMMEEIKRTQFVRCIDAPEAPSIPSRSRIVRAKAFTHPFTPPGHWSIVLSGYVRHPGFADVGLRLNHAEDTSRLATQVPLIEVLPLLVGVVTGKISIQSLLSNPERGMGGGNPESPYDLEGRRVEGFLPQLAAISNTLHPHTRTPSERRHLGRRVLALLIRQRLPARLLVGTGGQCA